MNGRPLLALASAALLSVAGAGCASSGRRTATQPVDSTAGESPGAGAKVFRGVATLDGRAFSEKFIGAVVLDNGLVTACQASIPPVRNGAFSLPVLAASQSAGCGRSGAKVVPWVYIGDVQLYAQDPIAWDVDPSTQVKIHFTRAVPRGPVPPLTGFFGAAYDSNGKRLPAGTRIEARIGDAVCGVASIRTGEFDGYLMGVLAGDASSSCPMGARIELWSGRHRSAESIVNDGVGKRDPIDVSFR